MALKKQLDAAPARGHKQRAYPTIGAMVCGALLTANAAAQQFSAANSAHAYPNRPIRMVIAFPPGGSNDIIARFIGVRLTAKFGRQIVYDYRGGASGVIGTEIVARAAPDGYTLLFASTSHTMNELFKRHAGIDLGHVAYKGGGASSFAVLAGEVPLMFSTMPLGLPFVRTEKLRALGVGGATRSPLLPAVPTLSEGGARG